MTPVARDFVRAFLRSFAVQASWNHRSQQAGGLCYALVPLLRRIHGGDPEALRESIARHLEPFNAHPYLATLAVGALARLEAEGADASRIARRRRALTTSLGAVGDRLVWSGWRPFCLLVAVAVYSLGGTVAVTLLLFLVLYNAGHVGLRAWALRVGWRDGPEAVQRLTEPAVRRAARALSAASAALAGFVGITVATGAFGGAHGFPAAALAAGAGVVAGAWSRPDLAARLAPWAAAVALVLILGPF